VQSEKDNFKLDDIISYLRPNYRALTGCSLGFVHLRKHHVLKDFSPFCNLFWSIKQKAPWLSHIRGPHLGLQFLSVDICGCRANRFLCKLVWVSLFACGLSLAISQVLLHALSAGTGPIHMNSVQCTGREKSITECIYKPVPLYSCKHNQDVAVRCNVPITGMQATVRNTHKNTLL